MKAFLSHSALIPVLAAASLAVSGCSSSAFMSMDPWPGSMREQQSDAWLSGGRYGEGSIVASDVPVAVADQTTTSNLTNTPSTSTPELGGLEPAHPSEEPLLAWDGDVIDGPERGAVVERDDPTHGLEPSPGGRTYLLQLYQDVLDERDKLEDEVRALRKAIGEAQARIDDSSASTSGLAQRMDSLEAEVNRLAAENEDLAARLATTQIRRLEAEKMLLEARIDWYRMQEAPVSNELMAEPMSTGMGSGDKGNMTGSQP